MRPVDPHQDKIEKLTKPNRKPNDTTMEHWMNEEGRSAQELRVICSIPVKARSERVERKNFLRVEGHALYERVIDRALEAQVFAEVIVNTDSAEVAAYAAASGARVHAREEWLSGPAANGNDLLMADAAWWEERREVFGEPAADAWCQLFATAPFLRARTVRRAVAALAEHPLVDSVFTAERIPTCWAWLDGQPLYDLDGYGRSQDEPAALYRETTGLYLIRTKALMALQRRVGLRPLPLVVSGREGMDIDTWEDVAGARKLEEGWGDHEVLFRGTGEAGEEAPGK